MADVAANYEQAAVHAVALWLELTHPDPDDFAAVYEPLRQAAAQSAELTNAAHTVQEGWTEEEHRKLLDKYLATADGGVPDDALLNVLGFAYADENQVAELLISRFSAATNNTQRQAVVALWGSANFNGDAVRRQLVEVVIYGLLDLKISSNNAGAAELALNALNSVGKPLPSRIKGALGKRVKSAVTGTKSLEDRALVVLPTLGYKTTTNFFGKPKRVRYDD